MIERLWEKASVNITEPITQAERQIVESEYQEIQHSDNKSDDEAVEPSAENTIDGHQFSNGDIRFASDFRGSRNYMCKRRSKSQNKKRLEKKRKSKRARKQTEKTTVAHKYIKEMRNRDALQREAARLYRESALTLSQADDKFAESAMFLSDQFDDLIYGTATSDVIDTLDDMYDEIDVDFDFDELLE